MIKHNYTLAALAALALAAPAAKAEFYWLASDVVKNTSPNNSQSYKNTLTLTNDDESVSYNPIVITDVRQDDTNSRRLVKYSRDNNVAPYDGCAYGGADLDLTLPIKDAAGNVFTLVKLVDAAFQDNNYIGSIKFPKSLEEIGTYAFRKAYYLKSAEFPSDTSALAKLGAQIFDSCTSLEGYFVWPSQCSTLGQYTFYKTKIQGFYGPSVTSVGGSAFNSCTSLTAIEFGASVEFGSAVFQNTKKTAGAGYNILFHDAPPVLDSNNNLIGGSNGVLDWWGTVNANATVYIPFNAAKNGATEKWAAFKDDFEKAVEGNSITWPTDNGDGTWADGSIKATLPNKTVRLRFWDPEADNAAALLAY